MFRNGVKKTLEAAYTRNISYHREIKTTPYEAVHGIRSHRETENHEEQPRKRKKITENQEKYNNEMVSQSRKKTQPRQFKVGDIVSLKIDRVDKTSPLHSNLLLGKIEEIVNTYARVVTKFGRINALISPTYLNPCTATTQNTELDYTTEQTLFFCIVQESYLIYLKDLSSYYEVLSIHHFI